MHFTYHEIKHTLYILLALFGAAMLLAAVYCFEMVNVAADPLVYLLPALVLAVTGTGTLVFAVWAHHFRNDPDIWR